MDMVSICGYKTWFEGRGGAMAHLGGDGELRDDDSHRVGVLVELPGAAELQQLLMRAGRRGRPPPQLRRRRPGVSQPLQQGLQLVEVRLLAQKLHLFEVARQRQFGRAEEVQDVTAEKNEHPTLRN